jgi:hypothetical protein
LGLIIVYLIENEILIDIRLDEVVIEVDIYQPISIKIKKKSKILIKII